MVTLMLTFFILLYSFSTLDISKWKSVVYSLQGALGPLDGNEGVLEGLPGIDGPSSEKDDKTLADESIQSYLEYQQEIERLEEIRSQLQKYLSEIGLQTSITVTLEERGLLLRFQDSVLFEKGKADLLPGSREILREVAVILLENENQVRIEGHTDDLPINTPRFPSNWELSTSRATNVLRFIVNEGLPGDRLSAVGYGEYRPIAPNDGEANRGKNRRVDMVLLRESLGFNEP
jgi:chemotaxis protein MotB